MTFTSGASRTLPRAGSTRSESENPDLPARILHSIWVRNRNSPLRSDIDPLAVRRARGLRRRGPIKLEAPEGEPLKLELESFIAALKGEAPVVVTGEEGRLALGVALQIVKEIELTLPSLVGFAHHHA